VNQLLLVCWFALITPKNSHSGRNQEEKHSFGIYCTVLESENPEPLLVAECSYVAEPWQWKSQAFACCCVGSESCLWKVAEPGLPNLSEPVAYSLISCVGVCVCACVCVCVCVFGGSPRGCAKGGRGNSKKNKRTPDRRLAKTVLRYPNEPVTSS